MHNFIFLLTEEDLDKQLSKMIQKVSLKKDWAEWMLTKLENEEKLSAQSLLAFVQKRKKQIDSVNKKLQLLLDSYLDQIIDRQTYLLKKQELMSNKKTFEEQIINFEQKQNDWLGPMKEWINVAANAARIANSADLLAKKKLAAEIFGSDLILRDKKARGSAQNLWAALTARRGCLTVVGSDGFGPSTSRM